jgi:hypothetical protein
MPQRLKYDFIKSIINKEDQLISDNYTNNKQLLEIKCNLCNQMYKQTFDRYYRGYRHKVCSNKVKIFLYKKEKEERICIQCNKVFTIKRSKQKICTRACSMTFHKTDKHKKEKCKIYGRKGGIISAAKQIRRSKAEIFFAELCKNHFGKENVKTNELLFKDKNDNYWDCDVILTNLKIGISYNGIWHYKQVRKNHKLAQVQARDTIKKQIVKDNGYSHYIIRDLGKFDKTFITLEFYKFLHSLVYKKVLKQIIRTF